MSIFKINLNLRLIDRSYRKGLNCVKIERGNSMEHENLKFLVCFILKNKNYEFITEGRFISGGRCDIFDLSNSRIYEILHTENPENIEEKKKYYPDVEIICLQTKHYKGKSQENIIQELEEIII